MKKLLFMLVASIAATSALADDLVPPPWRIPGQPPAPNSTFQEWTWDRGAQNPNDGTADNFNNPYGTPEVVHPAPNPPYPILGTFEGRTNVLCLDPGRKISFKIPNVPNAPTWAYKELWFQLTYFSGSGAPLPQPSPPPGGTGATIGHMPLGGGWMHSTFSFTYPDCPEFEIVSVDNQTSNPIYMDQVVIDTICVPEPTSMAVLGIGALAFLRKRRKA